MKILIPSALGVLTIPTKARVFPSYNSNAFAEAGHDSADLPPGEAFSLHCLPPCFYRIILFFPFFLPPLAEILSQTIFR